MRIELLIVAFTVFFVLNAYYDNVFFDRLKLEKNKKITDRKNKKFNASKELFTLFTSGSTGVPKGITHSSAGFLVYTKYTCIHQFGMSSDSIILTASDAGWLNGHTYALFGPLSLGATSVLIEKPMLLIDDQFLKKVLKLKITILYLPVTLIRLMKVKSLENISNFQVYRPF